jgi:group I intron endonuclease
VIGVYTILNLVTGRCYVGSSADIASRWRIHLSALSREKHPNSALQADWTQYGVAAFSWTVSRECETRNEAILAEQHAIDSTPDLYNAARRAGSGPRDGFKHTEESRRRMSDAQKGKPKSAAMRAKLSAAKKGKPCPAQSAALRGRKLSPAHCESIRIGHLGKKHTDEHKAYMSALLKGRDTSAWAWKMAATKRGQPWSALRRAAFLESKKACKSLEDK